MTDAWIPRLREPLERVRDGRVVGIGAICDLNTPPPDSPGSGSYSVSEFVRLEDRRCILLHKELGFSHSPPKGPGAPSGQGFHYSADLIKRNVLNTVLPDDDEEAAREAHPWEWLAALARARGVTVTADELRQLDYEVVFSEALEKYLAEA
jgi:hypothetical protein